MEAIQQGLLLGLEVLLVAGVVLLFFQVRHRFGLAPLYVAVGTFQYLSVVVTLSLGVELLPGLMISPGSTVLFTATLFSVLLVYIHEDAEETRLFIYALALANVALVILSNLFGLHLDSPLTANFLELPRALFFQDLKLMLAGTVLLILDGVLVILLFEVLGRWLRKGLFWRTFLSLAPVLALDSLLFIAILGPGEGAFATMLISSLTGKTFAAALFACSLALYTRWSGSQKTDASSGPLHPGDIYQMLTFRQKYEQLKASREEVATMSDRLNLALSAARLGAWDWDVENDSLVWDEQMFRTFGVDPEGFSNSSREFFDRVHPDDRERLQAELDDDRQQVDTTYRLVDSGDGTRYIRDRARVFRGPDGELTRIIGVCWDITDQEVAEKERERLTRELHVANATLEQQATRDPLTGLLNRRGLEAEIEREIARSRRTDSSFVAVLIDCDDFKGINDGYGHHVGDAVLVTIAQTIQSSLRLGDLVGRIGGDEFMAFLPETRLAEGETVLEKLRDAVARAEPPGLGRGIATISLGAARVPPEETNLRHIVALTQAVLKRSKAAGKDRVSMESGPQEVIEQDIPPGQAFLKAGHLASIAHPILDLYEETEVAFEYVLRGPEGVWELPEALFSHAACGDDLNGFDIATALFHLDHARDLEALEGRMHLNLLPSTLLSTPIELLFERLSEKPSLSVCIELHEQGFTGSPAKFLPAIRMLRSLGASIALDGIALSKPVLELLLVVEPEFVKLNRFSFAGFLEEASARRKVARLLRVVRSLGACAIAVGIDTEREKEALMELGLTLGQGLLWRERSRHLSQPTISAD